MRLGFAFAATLALTTSAWAQSASVQLPENVFVAVPFMIDVSLDCPPPGEVPPPIGCNGQTGAWFEVSDRTALIPAGFVTLLPFHSVRAGPFTFHRPGRQAITILTFSREAVGEVNFLAEVSFVVQPPKGPVRK